MVAPGSQDASITFTMRLRDQVSQAMGRVESSFNRVGTAASSTARFVGQNATAIVGISGALFSASGQLATFAQQLGLVNEEQAQTLQLAIQGGAAISAFGTFAVQLAQLVATTGLIARLGGIGASLTAIATGATAAAGAMLALGGAIQSIRGELPPVGQFLENIGVPSPQIIPTETGRRIGRTPVAGGGAPNLPGAAPGSGTQIAFNVGTLVADEIGLREFSKRIGRILQEEARIGGFSIN